jgi:hypothetical protein
MKSQVLLLFWIVQEGYKQKDLRLKGYILFYCGMFPINWAVIYFTCGKLGPRFIF